MMKELYVSPEAKLISFVAQERLATDDGPPPVKGEDLFGSQDGGFKSGGSVAQANGGTDIPYNFFDWK